MSDKLLDVANYFITKSHKEKRVISHLKLQKLVYYAEAWILAVYGVKESFTDDDFQAWVNGPVSPRLFKQFAYTGARDLPQPEGWTPNGLSKNQLIILKEVWRVYGHLDAWRLVEQTHKEEPWIYARGELVGDEYAPSSNIIPKEMMRTYYASLLPK